MMQSLLIRLTNFVFRTLGVFLKSDPKGKLPLSLVDVGASYFVHKPWRSEIIRGNLPLIAVDPNSENLSYVKNLGTRARISSVGKALWSSVGDHKFYKTNVDSGSSLLPPNPLEEDFHRDPNLRSYLFPVEEKELYTSTLDAELSSTTGYFAVKLDTQGSELEILRGAKDLLNRREILSVETEVSLLSNPIMLGSAKLDTLFQFLEQNGFELIWIRPVGQKNIFGKLSLFKKQREADVLFTLKKSEVLADKNGRIESLAKIYEMYGLEDEVKILESLRVD